MSAKIGIQNIINFLEDRNLRFTFHGEKTDVINGFSTLFNYREGTITFVSSLNKFSNYTDQFNDKKIKLIITDSAEQIHDCFINTIQIERPKQTFFSILDRLFDNDFEENTISIKEEIFKQNSYVSEKANIGENVKIGIGCIIEGNVSIG